MTEQVEIKNPDVSVSQINQNRKFILHFTEKKAKDIQNFCNSYILTLDDFSVKTIISYLGAIEDDIFSKEFSLIGSYFDISVFTCTNSSDILKKETEKSITIEVEFPSIISEVIHLLCDKLLFTPEEFIEDTINWKIESIIEYIKKGNYEFLAIYKDFTRVREAIENLIEEI